jgi:Domain of unknown function (DUF1876)
MLDGYPLNPMPIRSGASAAHGAPWLVEGDCWEKNWDKKMYDSNLENIWHVEIEFAEDEVHTHATVRAQLRGGEQVTTTGDAYRNPKDESQPMVGEEIAAARALIALGTELLQTASKQIEKATQHPVHLAG